MLFLALLTAAAAHDHPWHRTTAEIDLRQDPPRIEVALQVDAVELEQTLSRLAGRSLSLDRPEEIRPHVERYLRDAFLVRSRAGHWVEFSYLGHEADLVEAWLYFEGPQPFGPGPLQLSNQMLFERNAYQENLLLVRAEDLAVALNCTREQPWVELSGWTLPLDPHPPVGWSVRLPPTPGTADPQPRSVADRGPVGAR